MRREQEQSDNVSPATPPGGSPPPLAAEGVTQRPAGNARRRSFLFAAALYPASYGWYVFLSAVDVIFTWIILRAGGREINALADWIIDRHNVAGLVMFKFAMVALVVLVCEVIGRRDFQRGLKLARWAVALSAFPVVVGGAHLLRVAMEMNAG